MRTDVRESTASSFLSGENISAKCAAILIDGLNQINIDFHRGTPPQHIHTQDQPLSPARFRNHPFQPRHRPLRHPHPLADHRRQLPIDRLGTVLDAAPGFCLVVSYNPGYQSVLKDLKDSTRQRMVALELTFPPPDVEEKIVAHEAGVDHDAAAQLVQLGQAIRRLEHGGLREVASTRVLIAAGRLMAEGLRARVAARTAVVGPLTDDPLVTAGLTEMVDVYLDDGEG